MSAHASILRVFDRVAGSFAAGDREAFASLCSAPSSQLLQLFEGNSKKLRAKNWQLRLKEITQEGGLAVLRFDVIDVEGS